MAESLKPGDVCPTCTRKIPEPPKDGPPSERAIFSVSVPKGESRQHTLDEPLELLHERFTAAGAQNLPPIGKMTGWKFYTLALAFAVLIQTGVVPSETGG